MNGTRERSRTSLADHLLFTRRRGRQRWKPGFFDHYVDARHGASAYSASIASARGAPLALPLDLRLPVARMRSRSNFAFSVAG
jgi:hypothetical protein